MTTGHDHQPLGAPLDQIEDAKWEEIAEPVEAASCSEAMSAAAATQTSTSNSVIQGYLALAKKVIKNIFLAWLILTFAVGGLRNSCTSARRFANLVNDQIDTNLCPPITGIPLFDSGPRVLLGL